MNGSVDAKKICFIICSNNQMYTEECIYYINHLEVPEGYQIEIRLIRDAKSMTSGYNEGMRSSNAKYKVYLHQDTFIVNHNFIPDILDIFWQDEAIGMIGMVGSPQLPSTAVMWDGIRCGGLYVCEVHETLEAWMEVKKDRLEYVEVIDGFCMITQYDIPWREDLFDKWDFYDCSQSMEFARHGYRVVVPGMREPWCLHNTAISNLTNYHGECLKFLDEYRQEMSIFRELDKYKATVVLMTYNQKYVLQDTIRWLEEVEGVSNIIIIDNGSDDATAQWLATQPYEYIWFDEGVQGLGKVWNAVLENFETEDYIIFLAAGVYPAKSGFVRMMEALCTGYAEMVSPVSNTYPWGNEQIKSRKDLDKVTMELRYLPSDLRYRKILSTYWKMWAVHKSIFEKNGYFREELRNPQDVLTDYALRMMMNGYAQAVCNLACAYDSFRACSEVYVKADEWSIEDRNILKNIWRGMNYFNLRPNMALVNYIQEERDSEFKVLEIGCDLGATLYEIQSCYPKCAVYGVDINQAAVDIARHIIVAEYGDIDELKIPFREKFDYIIFGDVLEHLRHPQEVLELCHGLLNADGMIIASVPNIMHLSVMEELIEGRFMYEDSGLLDKTHIHFFTYYEIIDMFHRAGYSIDESSIRKIRFPLSDRQKELEAVLLGLSDHTQDWMYETFQYIVKARKDIS